MDIRLEAEAQAREAAAAARRREAQQAADAALERELRARFFASNPAGSDADFRRLLPQMRDAELVRRTEAARNQEVEILRQRYGGLI